MKTTAFILAMYFLFIGAVPCCEPRDCQDEIAKTEQHSNTGSKDHPCNNCSPFFNCECGCVLPMVVDASTVTVFTFPALSHYYDFIIVNLSSAHLDFWQPPKIS